MKYSDNQQKKVLKLAGKIYCLANAYHNIPIYSSEGMLESMHFYLENEWGKYRNMLTRRGYEACELSQVVDESKAVEVAFCCLNDPL